MSDIGLIEVFRADPNNCSYDDFLREKEQLRLDKKEFDKCNRIRHNAGYDTLSRMKYKEGVDYNGMWRLP